MKDMWSLMVFVFLAGNVMASTTTYRFLNDCDFHLHTLGDSDAALVRFTGYRLPSSNCSIGFQSISTAHSVCVVSRPPFTLNVFGPTLILSQGDGQVNSKIYNSLLINPPSRYCTSGGRYLNIALDNANTGSSTSRDRGYFTLQVTVLQHSPPSPTPGHSDLFKDNCDFRLHTLGKNDVGTVRFSGARLPRLHCSIGFQSQSTAHSVCVVSQPPFTLNVFGPRLTLSQGNGQVYSKSYTFLSIVAPSRYCTSGGRYLNIALDNANTGSSTSRDRGYFTLQVSVEKTQPSPSSAS
ncbi:hypothetical protein KP79_PYT12034 [Mizuhopecten yessoensis]|uniref:CUB domain-containing protein n=1 Tax=Mizuhopecten yessoensis TaxID=6573 RepID=A0A210R6L0_MIZYE|nr:hypothetical protein KP79_PYT12034 [Mizuhopecten yessoensis]